MHRKYSNFLIVSFVALSIFGVYSYFSNDLKSEAASSNSDLSSSLAVAQDSSNLVNDKTKEDTAFLMNLISLRSITVNSSLFAEPGFKLLIDNNIKIDKEPYGRANPFASTDKIAATVNTPTFSIKTSAASSIQSKSAIINGSIEGATSNNIYFEYGTSSETLDKTTAKVIPSLVGSFGVNLTGLNPKTTYFFRSAALINNVMNFGETISFSTN